MDEHSLIQLPRLSQEAISLFFAGVSYASPVDLRPYAALQGDYSPAVIRAAQIWGLMPEAIEVVGDGGGMPSDPIC
jgi:hypothetical protein